MNDSLKHVIDTDSNHWRCPSHAPSSRGEQNYRYFSQANIIHQMHDDALSNSRQQTNTRPPPTVPHSHMERDNNRTQHTHKRTLTHTLIQLRTCRNENSCWVSAFLCLLLPLLWLVVGRSAVSIRETSSACKGDVRNSWRMEMC